MFLNGKVSHLTSTQLGMFFTLKLIMIVVSYHSLLFAAFYFSHHKSVEKYGPPEILAPMKSSKASDIFALKHSGKTHQEQSLYYPLVSK